MSARDDAGIAAALDAFESVLDDPHSETAERAAARATVLDAIDAYKAQRTGIAVDALAPRPMAKPDAFDADAYPDEP